MGILDIMGILVIMEIFTCFTLRYIKPMIENRYLVLFFVFIFFFLAISNQIENFAPPLLKTNFQVQDTAKQGLKVVHKNVSLG